jgi:competence protein ComEA
MGWPVRTRERAPTEEDRRRALRRLAAISRRSPAEPRAGWVPEVPEDIEQPQEAAVRGGRLGLESGHAVVIVLVVLLGLAGAALLLGIGRPRVEPVEGAVTATVVATGTPASGLAEPDDSAAGGASAQLVVHVAGKVRTPGIVRLPPGSRVLDAVDAAGGAKPGVDLTGLNLARLLTDGEQVLVGVPPPAGGGAAAAASPGAAAGPVNLNTATAEALESLPGIGPALAGRILAWRTEHGRFMSVDELQEVSGIGPAIFAELADLVTV